ncbi:MAG: NAD-dependent epimerase/dehydratase family protein [Chloroflexi bacterium]|nr:NAD-dependent epimerase/dehydratase family protein [Chloroflexota bacterium]
MKILITGATGFLGTRLAAAALARGDSVRGLVRDLDRAAELRATGVETVQGDMLDAESLQRAVQGVDCIFHTAAVIGDWPDRGLSRRVNVEGTRTLVSLAIQAQVQRVVHFSSLAVYGNQHHRGTDESAPYRYGDIYTDAKIDSERVVFDLARGGAIEAVSLRPGFIYGPGDRTLLPKLLEALSSRKFMFVGDGSKQMNCVYVEDVVQAAMLASTVAGASGRAYNVTDGQIPELRDFIAFIAEYCGLPMPTKHVPPILAVAGCYTSEHVGHLLGLEQAPLMNISRLRFLYYNQAYSIQRARQELGYSPQYAIRDGLPPTLDWFGARSTNAVAA